jgi:hypothetical protein
MERCFPSGSHISIAEQRIRLETMQVVQNQIKSELRIENEENENGASLRQSLSASCCN